MLHCACTMGMGAVKVGLVTKTQVRKVHGYEFVCVCDRQLAISTRPVTECAS